MKTEKAPGPILIRNEVQKSTVEYIADPLVYILNELIDN